MGQRLHLVPARIGAIRGLPREDADLLEPQPERARRFWHFNVDAAVQARVPLRPAPTLAALARSALPSLSQAAAAALAAAAQTAQALAAATSKRVTLTTAAAAVSRAQPAAQASRAAWRGARVRLLGRRAAREPAATPSTAAAFALAREPAATALAAATAALAATLAPPVCAEQHHLP